MNACVYILQFSKSGRFYVGSTDNLARRLAQHRSGNTPSTKALGSFRLAFHQETKDLVTARWAEKRIKSWKRKDFIERIIRDGTISFLDDGITMHP